MSVLRSTGLNTNNFYLIAQTKQDYMSHVLHKIWHESLNNLCRHIHLNTSPRVLLSGKGKPAPLESQCEERSILSWLPELRWIQVWGQYKHSTYSSCSSTRAGTNQLSLALWHYQEKVSKPLQTLLLLNEPGLMMWETSGGRQKEEIRKEKVYFPRLSRIPNLAAQSWICTLFEKQRQHLQRDLPVCLGLGNISSVPSQPPPLPDWGHAKPLLFWAGHSDESAILTLHCQDPTTQQLSTLALKIHLFL